LYWAIVTVIVLLYLVEIGISVPIATLVAGIINTPWILKVIWGPLVDYYLRLGRKRFILMGGVLAAACLFIVSFLDPLVALLPFTVILFVGHVGIGFIDVSADGWAIQISEEKERGKINGSMFAGLTFGWGLGSFLFSSIAFHYGFHVVFIVGSVIVLLTLLFPLIVKEDIMVKQRQKVASLLLGEFKKKTTQLIALFSPIVSISFGILMFAVPLFMRTILEMNIVQIGLINAVFPFSMAGGALIGGITADRWRRKTNLNVYLGLSILSTVSLILVDSWQSLAMVYILIGFFYGCWSSALMAMYMDISNPKVGASQFAILTSLCNVGEMGIGNTLAGSLVTMLGFGRTFLYTAWIYGPALLLLYLIRLKKEREIISSVHQG